MLTESHLKPYQHIIIEHIVRHPKCAVWAAMGLGKTVSTLTAIERLQFCGHETKPALVLAPLRVAQNVWPYEVREWEHLTHMRVVPILGTAHERKDALYEPADVYTINYDNLEWLVDIWGDHWPYGMIVCDECFVAGTPILTPNGDIPIELLRVGDFVYNARGIGRVKNTFSRQLSKLVCVEFSGKKAWCSPGHLFFTRRGWVASSNLVEGDELYERDACVRILQSSVSQRLSEQILQQILLSEMENESAGASSEGLYSGNSRQDIGEAQSVFLGTFRTERAKEKCHTKYKFGETIIGGNTKSCVQIFKENGSCADEEGRERKRSYCTAGDGPRSLRGRMGTRASYTDAKNTRRSLLLQSGRRMFSGENSCGNRRIFSQCGCEESARQKEREVPSGTWVERVTVYKPGSVEFDRYSGGKNFITFFDVEVSGHPSFYAHNILVHNSTKLKSLRASLRQNEEGKRWVQGQGGVRAKKLLQTVFKFNTSRIVELTGTPSPNGLQDLWGQIFFLDYGKRLGRVFDGFKKRWFQQKWDGFGMEALPHAQKEIEGALKDIVISLRTEDWFDLEQPIVRDIWVDLPPPVMVKYRDLERKLYTEIQGHPIEAFNAGAKTSKLRQLAAGAAYLGHADDPGERQFTEAHSVKLDALEEIEEEASGMPLLIAYHFKSDLARLQKRFPKGRVLDAKTSTIEEWNTGKIPMLFAHPASAGHGLNLQRGSNILVYFNIDWNLEQQLQILERIGPVRQFQAGLKRNVFVYRILARKTVDEDLLDNNTGKGSIQDSLMKGMRRRLG